MSDRKGKLPSLVEWLVVAAIVGTLSCCLWPVVRDSSGRVGDPLARKPPDEAHRFHSEAGFSIVVPADWKVANIGLFVLVPIDERKTARRSQALISMDRMGNEAPPDIAGMKRTSFPGGEVAYERMVIELPWYHDDGPRSKYTLYFRHGGEWFSLEYTISEERTELPDSIRQYINTFRWDEGGFRPRTAPVSPPVR